MPSLRGLSQFGQKRVVPTVDRACFYCKTAGHLIANCPALKKKSVTKPVGLTSIDFALKPAGVSPESSMYSDKTGYAPFLHDGTVFVSGLCNPVPVRILRDTGAAQLFLLEGVLPLTEKNCYW